MIVHPLTSQPQVRPSLSRQGEWRPTAHVMLAIMTRTRGACMKFRGIPRRPISNKDGPND